MRCQDCGQQFTRLEAFKVHLRMHVEEAAEKERRAGKRPLQTKNEAEECERSTKDNKDGGRGPEDEEDFFGSSFALKPSDVFRVRPRKAMLSQDEKPVYNANSRVYPCTICGNIYSYLESFKNHQKTHETDSTSKPKEKAFKCPDCGKIFHRAISLSLHMTLSHKTSREEQNKPVELYCEQCNKTFSCKTTWANHMEHHKKRPHWCLACAKGFKDVNALDRHLYRHEQRQIKCHACFKSFRLPAELKSHYSTAHNRCQKPYRCHYCSRRFSHLGDLITHRKKHDSKVGVDDMLNAAAKPASVRGGGAALGPQKIGVVRTLVIGSQGGVVGDAHQRRPLPDFNAQPREEKVEDLLKSEGAKVRPLPYKYGTAAKMHGQTSVSTERQNAGSHSSKSSDKSADWSRQREEDVQITGYRAPVQQTPRRDVQPQEEEEEEVVLVKALAPQVQPQQQEGPLRCFICVSSFFQEADLHLHYMKHASGEL
ncbi:zinc finger protein 528-like [Engraulis encrasicolus]|uniref:zinc finger protein 528-like n=1 Tax=Engraulis encrasicolus TaxID=184585 RepID=UPI002FD6C8BC